MQGDTHGCWYIDASLDVPKSQLPMFSKLHFKNIEMHTSVSVT